MKAREVIRQFVAAINRRDAVALSQLMTDDHTFIDSDGSSHSGKKEMKEGWKEYFKLVPDHTIHVEDEFGDDGIVVMTGKVEGTYVPPTQTQPEPENHFHITAAWRGVVVGQKVKVWQVFLNPEPLVEIMKRYE